MKYYRPYFKGTNIPAFELSTDVCFPSIEDCEKFLKTDNPFYSPERYEIKECPRKKHILDCKGNFVTIE